MLNTGEIARGWNRKALPPSKGNVIARKGPPVFEPYLIDLAKILDFYR